MKITIKKDLLKQIENITDKNKKQIDSKNLYVKKSNFISNQFDFISYQTKIAIYNFYTKTLYITTKKYSQTTTKQQNQIKNNILKYNFVDVVYTNEI